MEAGSVTVLAVVGVLVAGACALACALGAAWLARSTHNRASTPPPNRMPASTMLPAVLMPQAPAPLPMLQAAPPTVIVQLTGHEASTHAIQPGAPAVHREPASGVVLEGRYPQLGAALGAWMQAERDPVERCRIAHDLGTIGSADAARSLLDGVRTGVLSPTIAVDNLERGGFDAGIAVAAALGDPSPDVRAVATSIVGRRAPLQASSLARAEHEPRPMPRPPRGPTGGHG